jgi:DNA invertase Pin-like site-specific DNA recombinase
MQQSAIHSVGNKSQQWSQATSQDEAARRAAGRARYNRHRQFKAAIRRKKIIDIWEDRADGSGWSIFSRGSQTELAKMLGVNRSTICRDLKVIMARNRMVACPTCEAALSIQRIEGLEREGKVTVTR